MDDILKYSWDINTITNNYETHSLEKGNKAIKIAVIDSGVDTTHPGLKKNVTLKKNFVETETSYDYTGHGTMVCGQIVGNDLIKGIVPNCQVDVIKVLDSNNSCSFKNFISALEYVYQNQYNIVNLSLGLSIKNKKDAELEYPFYLLKKLYDNGTICVNSVGYLKDLNEHFPSQSPYTFTVQSLNRNNEIVNKNLLGDYCVPSGDYFDTKLNNIDDYDEYVTVFFPINKSKELKKKYPTKHNLPIGYLYSIGESLASAKLSGIILAILSKYFSKYNYVLGPEEVSYILSKYSYSIDNRIYPNLYKILNNINNGNITINNNR